MKRYSWYTIVHPDWHPGEPSLYLLVGQQSKKVENVQTIFIINRSEKAATIEKILTS